MERIKYRMTLRCTSDHEAAHAVLSEKHGVPVLGVKVRRLKSGNWVGSTGPADGYLVHPIPNSVIMLAGSTAEALWHGHGDGYVSGGDFKHLIEIGMPDHALMREHPQMEWAWRLLWHLTEAAVRRHKHAILRVSKALQRKKKLTGDEVRAIIKRKR